MNLKIVNASYEDKEFILKANEEVNIASGLNDSILKKNIDIDIFSSKNKCNCLIAKMMDINVGMCIYSRIYWANLGEGIYLSQIYVSPEYRKLGIFKEFIKEIRKKETNRAFITCLVGDENMAMQKSLDKTGWKTTELKTYYFKETEFK